MPASAVEVLTPDHQSVRRFAMRPNSEESVDVPSERSYLRVHLPSGRAVTMPVRDDLEYVINREGLERSSGRYATLGVRAPDSSSQLKSVSEVRSYQEERSVASQQSDTTWLDEMYDTGKGLGDVVPDLQSGVRVLWSPKVRGKLSLEGDELAFSPPVSEKPYRLSITVDQTTMLALLPGSLDSTYVRSDDVGSGGTVVTVRVASASRFANTVGSYLARGDYYAAETMAVWAEQAEDRLQSKMRDPYAAAVAAYLLLRLERYDLMHDWAKNLADWFPEISDGCVIWAIQVLRQRQEIDEATEYLLKAAERGWPIYMEGTRLLSENLRRLGDDGIAAVRQLEHGGGAMVWDSPFTARVTGTKQRDMRAITFDLGYEPTA